jgi:WXG100 family type VII secretion target
MARIVVNPDTLYALKGSFDTQSRNLSDLTTALQGDVNNSLDDWQGHVADTFRSDWADKYLPVLNQLAQALTDAGVNVGTALQNALHADQQG